MVRGGLPSRAGRWMPAYESEDGTLQVFEMLIVTTFRDGMTMLFPRSYGISCLVSPDDMVPLHHGENAWWTWRPRLFRKMLIGWQGLGSQTELAWRRGLMDMMISGREGYTMGEADDRAAALLQENLSPQQRLELAALGTFRVRGAKTRNVYRIDIGNGFEIVDKATGEAVVSYCLHTDAWIPHDDVALATKLALEDPDLEVECLENARMTMRPRGRRATWADRRAAVMEREMIR